MKTKALIYLYWGEKANFMFLTTDRGPYLVLTMNIKFWSPEN